MKKPMLCWVDLETTGLNPREDRILQAAIALTTPELQLVADPFEVIISRADDVLAKMNDYVRRMHTDTGLLRRVAASQIRPEQAYSDMWLYVEGLSQGAHQLILAGSSVHFDRAFLARWVPRLEMQFYHRHLDVSALKHLAEWWGYPRFIKRGVSHLAPHDILESIDELKHYRATMLREL